MANESISKSSINSDMIDDVCFASCCQRDLCVDPLLPRFHKNSLTQLQCVRRGPPSCCPSLVVNLSCLLWFCYSYTVVDKLDLVTWIRVA